MADGPSSDDARRLADKYSQRVVLIITTDGSRVWFNSYGAQPEDKPHAARLLDKCVLALGRELEAIPRDKDFRYKDQAKLTAEIQRLKAKIEELETIS